MVLWQRAASLDPAENRAALGDLDAAGADLVILPEASARDFGKPGSPLAEWAEPLDGPWVTALVEAAGRTGATLVAGMFEDNGTDRPYNTVVVATADGVAASYRKIHLYDSFGYRESDTVTAGTDVTTFEVAGLQCGLITCYDLRFPEQVRQIAADIDLLLVPAAWVAGPHKVEHWRTLLAARAIENTVWVAAAAQPAPRYCGNSMVIDPMGVVVVEAGDGPDVVSAEVSATAVVEARKINPALANRRL